MLEEVGNQYGRLTVVEFSHKDKNGTCYWTCECVCGTKKIICGSKLRNGHTKSCGCYNLERVVESNTSHGLTKHPLYGLYHRIMNRCYNSKNKAYKNYGGRGIVFYWKDKLEDFIEYVLVTLGDKPTLGHTLDRVDNDKGYEPGNLRWATRRQQAWNTRRNSKHPGISFIKENSKRPWRVTIVDKGKLVFYNYYSSLKEALESQKVQLEIKVRSKLCSS